MARLSSTGVIKLQAGDRVRNDYGMTGEVKEIMVMRPDAISVDGLLETPRMDVLVVVDYTFGKGEPNVICLEEITAVKVSTTEWRTLSNEPFGIV